jgi:hypothetical protein
MEREIDDRREKEREEGYNYLKHTKAARIRANR